MPTNAEETKVGDTVSLDMMPVIRVEVLEIIDCDDVPSCEMGDGKVFRFKDPETGEDDWFHLADMTKVHA